MTGQLSLLAPGEPGACEPDCEICDGARRIGWTDSRSSVLLHESGGRLAEAYARARGAWPP